MEIDYRARKPVIVLEAKSPAGENEETTTFFRLCQMIVEHNWKDPRSDEQLLGIVPQVDRDWFEIIDLFAEPLPKKNPHIDWCNETHQAAAKKVALQCNGRVVIWSNRPWQAIKAAASLNFDAIRFCELQPVELFGLMMKSAWIWHPAKSIKCLSDVDGARIGRFLWEQVLEHRAYSRTTRTQAA